MKTSKTYSRMLACGLSLFVLPLVLAGGADKKLDKMDTNGDGQVSRAEHTAGAQRMFAELDTNRDGVVTATEMEAKADKKNRGEMAASEKIKMIDQNADGRLTAAEHAAGSEEMFAKMDTNQDGSLSANELEAGHKMKKHKRDS